VLWSSKLCTRHLQDVFLWHKDTSAGDQLPSFHPGHVNCYRDSVTVLLSAENMSPESSLYVVEGSESIPRDATVAMPWAEAGCAGAGLPKRYCASLRHTVDSGHFWSCSRENAHEIDLRQACKLRVADLLGRQTDEMLAFVRKYDLSARVRKLEQRDFEFSAFRSGTLHSSANLGNRTRVALQFQYVARGCAVRLPVTHAGPLPLGYDTAHPRRLAMTLDSGGPHAGGAGENPSPEAKAMEPAALAGLDLANLDFHIATNVTAVYSSAKYMPRSRAPWRREVMVLGGGAAGSLAPADRGDRERACYTRVKTLPRRSRATWRSLTSLPRLARGGFRRTRYTITTMTCTRCAGSTTGARSTSSCLSPVRLAQADATGPGTAQAREACRCGRGPRGRSPICQAGRRIGPDALGTGRGWREMVAPSSWRNGLA
jgi:hypothetical protein